MTAEDIYSQIESIPGWFDIEEIRGFQSIKLPDHPTIVECGTYCGRSTKALSLIYPHSSLVTCDPINEPDRLIPDGVTFYNTKGVDMPWNGLIDLLFIDDSHIFNDIQANVERFMPRVKPGGYIVFHDYFFEQDGARGVKEFVDQIEGNKTFIHGKYGLAIWRKP